MRFLAGLGHISPEGLRKALQAVIAIVLIVSEVLRFIERITREGNE